MLIYSNVFQWFRIHVGSSRTWQIEWPHGSGPTHLQPLRLSHILWLGHLASCRLRSTAQANAASRRASAASWRARVHAAAGALPQVWRRHASPARRRRRHGIACGTTVRQRGDAARTTVPGRRAEPAAAADTPRRSSRRPRGRSALLRSGGHHRPAGSRARGARRPKRVIGALSRGVAAPASRRSRSRLPASTLLLKRRRLPLHRLLPAGPRGTRLRRSPS